jgi:hypothetical protein
MKAMNAEVMGGSATGGCDGGSGVEEGEPPQPAVDTATATTADMAAKQRANVVAGSMFIRRSSSKGSIELYRIARAAHWQ